MDDSGFVDSVVDLALAMMYMAAGPAFMHFEQSKDVAERYGLLLFSHCRPATCLPVCTAGSEHGLCRACFLLLQDIITCCLMQSARLPASHCLLISPHVLRFHQCNLAAYMSHAHKLVSHRYIRHGSAVTD